MNSFTARYCSDPGSRKRWLIYGGGTTVFVIVLIIIIVVATSGGSEPEHFTGRMVLSEVPLIDGHNDLPNQLYKISNNQLKDFNFDKDLKKNQTWQTLHTDLLRLREGKVSGQFWVAYVECTTQYKDAVARTLEQIDVTKRLIARYPNDLRLVTTADGINEAFHDKKIASMLCVEGGHSIDSRMSILRLYYELGVRYLTLTHNCDTPWADNNLVDAEPKPENERRKLTEWGKAVVQEMNRLGMLVDLSHVSIEVMEIALNVSKAPVIFSHSSSRAMLNHTRNVNDDILQKLKVNNGIIMVNFGANFIAKENANISDVVKHLNHIKTTIGTDNIGIGADFDGVTKVTTNLEDVSTYPALFDLLAKPEGGETPWTREELQKLAGLNFLRVFKAVETFRDGAKEETPYEEHIPVKDIPENAWTCRSDSGKEDETTESTESSEITTEITTVITTVTVVTPPF